MKRWCLGIILLVFLSGCNTKMFTTEATPVGDLEIIGGYTAISKNAGLLYEYFSSFNAFTPSEGAIAHQSYVGMLGAIRKLQQKTVAGKTDYHRLLYFTEDMTDYWKDLRPILDSHVAAKLPDRNEYADALYIEIRGKVDAVLELSNVRLKQAKGEMDKASYEQFRKDAQNLIKTMSPLFQKGVDILL